MTKHSAHCIILKLTTKEVDLLISRLNIAIIFQRHPLLLTSQTTKKQINKDVIVVVTSMGQVVADASSLKEHCHEDFAVLGLNSVLKSLL